MMQDTLSYLNSLSFHSPSEHALLANSPAGDDLVSPLLLSGYPAALASPQFDTTPPPTDFSSPQQAKPLPLSTTAAQPYPTAYQQSQNLAPAPSHYRHLTFPHPYSRTPFFTPSLTHAYTPYPQTHPLPVSPKSRKRMRTTPEQLAILQQIFAANPTPNSHLRLHIARHLDLPLRSVQIWFQNRRAKAKLLERKERQGGGEEEREERRRSCPSSRNESPVSDAARKPGWESHALDQENKLETRLRRSASMPTPHAPTPQQTVPNLDHCTSDVPDPWLPWDDSTQFLLSPAADALVNDADGMWGMFDA
ncbi:uncharacterized protein VTP21DRAFT_10368 [Calcarisporiella thermophila]|uniref:uncharacterized protein n=1 Tax=Calcarisporiella thermophila TaxID=911321 RepID=UPI003742EA7A